MALFTVHYHEVALKRGNRGLFVRTLKENVQRAVGRCTVRSVATRFLVEAEGGDEALERAANVAGVSYVLKVVEVPRDLDAAARAAVTALEGRGARSFRISTRRSDKSFPLTSVEVDRQIGGVVHQATGVAVKLRDPDVDVQVAILDDRILVGCDRRDGPGGLPTGTGGRVTVLMSGGIDSPVAAWRMMKRGCRCDLVHFHSHPLVDRTTQEKARDLAEALTPWQFHTRLYLVPLAKIQTEIRLHCPEPMRVVLYRRFMVRIAERIAGRRKSRALVTGESLGQVASQTLENLATVDAAARFTVLRPLIGMDKLEIIRTAEQLGTYDISIRPDQDCCQLFVPPRPATKTSRAQAEAAEADLDVEGLVQDAVARAEVVNFE